MKISLGSLVFVSLLTIASKSFSNSLQLEPKLLFTGSYRSVITSEGYTIDYDEGFKGICRFNAQFDKICIDTSALVTPQSLPSWYWEIQGDFINVYDGNRSGILCSFITKSCVKMPEDPTYFLVQSSSATADIQLRSVDFKKDDSGKGYQNSVYELTYSPQLKVIKRNHFIAPEIPGIASLKLVFSKSSGETYGIGEIIYFEDIPKIFKLKDSIWGKALSLDKNTCPHIEALPQGFGDQFICSVYDEKPRGLKATYLIDARAADFQTKTLNLLSGLRMIKPIFANSKKKDRIYFIDNQNDVSFIEAGEISNATPRPLIDQLSIGEDGPDTLGFFENDDLVFGIRRSGSTHYLDTLTGNYSAFAHDSKRITSQLPKEVMEQLPDRQKVQAIGNSQRFIIARLDRDYGSTVGKNNGIIRGYLINAQTNSIEKEFSIDLRKTPIAGNYYSLNFSIDEKNSTMRMAFRSDDFFSTPYFLQYSVDARELLEVHFDAGTTTH